MARGLKKLRTPGKSGSFIPALQKHFKGQMKQYLIETLTVVSVAFLFLDRSTSGVVVFGLAGAILVAILTIEAFSQKKAPNIAKLEKDVSELKTISEQLILRTRK